MQGAPSAAVCSLRCIPRAGVGRADEPTALPLSEQSIAPKLGAGTNTVRPQHPPHQAASRPQAQRALGRDWRAFKPCLTILRRHCWQINQL